MPSGWPDILTSAWALSLHLFPLYPDVKWNWEEKDYFTVPLYSAKAVVQLTLTSQNRDGSKKSLVIKSTPETTIRVTKSPPATLRGNLESELPPHKP